MSKYFFLRRHVDVIQEGDEYKGWNPECTKVLWIKITKKDYANIIGTKRDEGFVSVRRKRR